LSFVVDFRVLFGSGGLSSSTSKSRSDDSPSTYRPSSMSYKNVQNNQQIYQIYI
jgi:hypothetical protein